ncbi:MAG: lysylphosphatidylglycerol synthase transmembrane domain-containing protein [Candidatus Omnitrophica bacterium]|nr:lysylphosphatidylglycerol synthase transmembrane domain-containing protein [Candidatus Omnitrophota bacterium]MDD5690703.1 lysylphosphatidylglycerol synthase transmembrane domain-containing protein [Candidatus Omnitrophota bacterium]
MLKFKKVLSVLLRIVISAVLLFVLFKFNKIDFSALMNDIKDANRIFLAVGFIFIPLVNILGFLRWKMLLKSAGIIIPLKKLISAFCGGIFFSIFLPSTIGGDLVKAVDLVSHTQKAKQVIATVFLDRLSGYIGLVLVVLPAIMLGGPLIEDKIVYFSVAIIVIMLIIVLLLLFNSFIYNRITRFLSVPGAGKIREAIKDMHREIHVFRNHKKMIVANLSLSLLIQALFPVSAYFVGLSLGVRIDLIYFLIFLPIIGAITLLPVSMGGLGLREGLYVVYFAKAGVIKQLALAMSLLSFSFIVFSGAIGGIIYVLTVHHRRLQHNQPPAV